MTKDLKGVANPDIHEVILVFTPPDDSCLAATIGWKRRVRFFPWIYLKGNSRECFSEECSLKTVEKLLVAVKQWPLVRVTGSRPGCPQNRFVRANKKGLKATDLPFMSGSWKGIGSTWTEQLGMVTGELSFFLVLREERITFQILQLKSTRNF